MWGVLMRLASAAVVVPVVRELTDAECASDVLCVGTMPELHLAPGIMVVAGSRTNVAAGNHFADAEVTFDQVFGATEVPVGLDQIDQRHPKPDGQPLDFLRDGTGVVLYSLDTGINCNSLPAYSSCTVDPDAASFDGAADGLRDHHGHGTAMASIASTLAQNASIVGVPVLDRTGRGSLSRLLYGLHRVAVLHNNTQTGVILAPLSTDSLQPHQLRSGGVADLIDQSIQTLRKLNVATVVSAGNNGVDACTVAPASSSSAVTVAAMLESPERAKFSNWGSCGNLFAPADASANGRAYSGTSVSAAYAAGAAASMASNTHLTADQLAQAVSQNASKYKIRHRRGTPSRFLHAPRHKVPASVSHINRYKAVAVTTTGIILAVAAGTVIYADMELYSYSILPF